MAVDSYAFLPRAFRAMFEAEPVHDVEPVWAAPTKPTSDSRVALVSSAGMFLAASQEPFDVERERREPTWGDPTLRVLPAEPSQSDIDARHLHINTADLFIDYNISLPAQRLTELAGTGAIGATAPEHYSVMGFQEEGAETWRTTTGPEIVTRCKAAEVDAVVLAPA